MAVRGKSLDAAVGGIDRDQSEETHVSIHGVGKVYESVQGPVQALTSVSVAVLRGQFVSILGPSGCGKSTLLMLVAGLLEPTWGKVLIDGREVDGPRPDTGVVFQEPVLLPWRSVTGNVLYPIELQKKG